MKVKLSTFILAGLIAAFLDWTRQLDLLFSIELAIVRGIVGLWVLEFFARIGRALVDAATPQFDFGELVDRGTSTLLAGSALYVMFGAWISGTAILDGAFSSQPYTMFASFLKIGSAFTVALWLLLNMLAFLAGSRKRAHDFLVTLRALAANLADENAGSASTPIEEYESAQ